MANGVPLEEVNQILGQDVASLEAKDPAEAAAILFARYYAEHQDQIDPASIENLKKHYSDAQVTEILAYVRAITFGNLAGNSLESVLERFRGRREPRSRKEASVADPRNSETDADPGQRRGDDGPIRGFAPRPRPGARPSEDVGGGAGEGHARRDVRQRQPLLQVAPHARRDGRGRATGRGRPDLRASERAAGRGGRETADDAAIRFGRRYAERLDQVDPEALEQLRRHYGDAQVDEVLAYVRFITFANLLGNTADAFLGKLFLSAAGVAASPLALFMLFAAGLDRRVGMDAYSPTPRRRPEPTPRVTPRVSGRGAAQRKSRRAA